MKTQSRTFITTFAKAALPVAAMVCLMSTASAAVTYGVSASGQADASVPGSTPVSNSYSTGAFLQQSSYVQSSNYSAQAGSGNVAASSSVLQQSVSSNSLHESISASSTGSGTSATASGYIAWLDTISFAGAPTGTSVTVQLTNVYDGSFNITGNIASGTSVQESATLTGSASNINLVNNYTTSQSNLNVSQVQSITSTVGSTLSLEEQLSEFISGTGSFSGSANFSNTEQVYLTVLTPGVSLVSASGANYALPSAAATPEPSALLLVPGGLLALAAFRKKA